MGVNKLLKAGIAKENLQLKGESVKKETIKAEKKVTAKAAKNKGGRPTNKERGLQKRFCTWEGPKKPCKTRLIAEPVLSRKLSSHHLVNSL